MTTELYFVRHAASDISVKDERTRPLSGQGKKDAQKLLQIFKHVKIDHIYSSPYTRSIDTVKYLAESHGKTIITCENLRERTIGRWIDDFPSYAYTQWKDFHYRIEHGESLYDVQARNIAEVQHLLDEHENSTIVIGTHGTALGTILNYYDKEFGFERFWAMVDRMPYIIMMIFENSSFKSTKELTLS
ncbi:MAG: histidine phosphatase family protein [Desulfobacteraceae bacterium]|nr:histidine phosphatase family protein [Desulfobacteraceae bacterium]